MATICSYVAEVRYDDRKPFRLFSPTMTVEKLDTEQATEQAATLQASVMVREFIATHFPEGTPVPKVVRVRLGSMVFVPGGTL